ncbi:MAG TPA: class I SAM-dependent methyltransferase family protein [Candidatus Deferrimicrobium sp.]|nr:class I SAM-dependent methyltransferase family protein [Candidatus Deferrimicrobium sp.]
MRKRLRSKLSGSLPTEQLRGVYNSFDIIGNIAIIKYDKIQNPDVIAKQIMTIHRNVKAVFTPATRIEGDYRVRELRHLAGENKTSTIHKESGCTFRVDVEKCYFSPRLSFEHKRIAGLVGEGEVVVNMFAGVGTFSIIIAKAARLSKIYSIDVNPTAVKCMEENVEINHVCSQVFPLFGDSKEIIKTKLQGLADRVLMPLPEKAQEYLPFALSTLKQAGGWIHYYDFQHVQGREDPVEKTKFIVAKKLDELGVGYEFISARIIRPIGPNWYQTVLDVHASKF